MPGALREKAAPLGRAGMKGQCGFGAQLYGESTERVVSTKAIISEAEEVPFETK